MTDMTVFSDTTYKQGGKWTEKTLPPLNDPGKLRVLFNKVFDSHIITNEYAEAYLAPELANATRLLAFLKKEYNMK